jgi:hypothetical protein
MHATQEARAMIKFGRREIHAGSGIDKPEPPGFGAKWKSWVADFLRPLRRAPTGNHTAQPIRRKRR